MANRAACGRCVRGFTLVELVVTLAVLAILTTVAIPSFNNFMANQRVKSSAQGLFTSLNFARSEAIRRNGEVLVRISSNVDGPVWIVTPTATQDPVACLDSTATSNDCLRVNQATTAVTIDGATEVTFTRNGRATAGKTFSLCDAEQSDSVAQRVIRVDLTGRPNIALEGGCAP